MSNASEIQRRWKERGITLVGRKTAHRGITHAPTKTIRKETKVLMSGTREKSALDQTKGKKKRSKKSARGEGKREGTPPEKKKGGRDGKE